MRPVFIALVSAAFTFPAADSRGQAPAAPPAPSAPGRTFDFSESFVVPVPKSADKQKKLKLLGETYGAKVYSDGLPPDTQIWQLQSDKVKKLLDAANGGGLATKPSTPFTLQMLDGDVRNLFSSRVPQLNPAQELKLQLLSSRPGILGKPFVTRMRLDALTKPVILASTTVEGMGDREIKLNIDPKATLLAKTQSFKNVAGQSVWVADVKRTGLVTETSGQAGVATLVVDKTDVSGLIVVGGDVYTVNSLGAGNVAVFRQERDVARDHPTEKMSSNPQAEPEPEGAFDSEPISVRALILYTKNAGTKATKIEADVASLIAFTNNSFVQSGIGTVSIEVAGISPTSHVETDDIVADTRKLMARINNPADALFKMRREKKANIVILIADYESPPLPCGWSPMIKADVKNAVATVSYACLFNNFSLTHEIGHIFGARHDVHDDPDAPYTYGHGYIRKDRWRTIMAYPSTCVAKMCPRIPYWATPHVQHPDDKIPLGTRELEFDARVIKEQASRVARLKTW